MRYNLLLVLLLLMAGTVMAQKKNTPAAKPTTTFDEKLYNGLEWRSIGPFRGGRSASVTGVPGKPN
ncbi:MAG: hypothetical protein ACK5XL_18725, partial [Cyclobacteriaceae bacterium]